MNISFGNLGGNLGQNLNTSFEVIHPNYQTELKKIDDTLRKRKWLITALTLFCLLVNIAYSYIFLETAEIALNISSSQDVGSNSAIFFTASTILILQGAIYLAILVNLRSNEVKRHEILNRFLLGSIIVELIAIIIGFFLYGSITQVLLFSSGWTYNYYVSLGKSVLIFNIVLNVLLPVLVYTQTNKIQNLLLRLEVMRYGPSISL